MGDDTISPEDLVALNIELGECARYGEKEDLKSILEIEGIDVDFTDAQGSSALHKAAANGHADLVEILVNKGANCFPNQAGNSPLHWALQTRKAEASLKLLQFGQNVDVLEQNGQGKSAITLAYDFNDTSVLSAVLEHSSASRLNKDGSVASKGQKSDLEKEEELERRTGEAVLSSVEQAVVSKVYIGDSSIEVREIGWFQLGEDDDLHKDLQTTGGFLWAASLILSRWILDLKPLFANKLVVELGAGCGLPSLVAAQATEARQVWMTDMECATFANSQANVELNSSKKLSLEAVDWFKTDSWSDNLVGKTDILIGSDLVYDLELVAPLLDTVMSLAAPGAVFFYVSADQSRAGCKEFVEALSKLCVSTRVDSDIPSHYVKCPFVNESSFHLRFPELFSDVSFKMYTFHFKN